MIGVEYPQNYTGVKQDPEKLNNIFYKNIADICKENVDWKNIPDSDKIQIEALFVAGN